MNTDANPFAGYMSPTRLVEQRTLEEISISLERLEEPRELEVCLEEAIKGQHHHNSHRHGQDRDEPTRTHVQS